MSTKPVFQSTLHFPDSNDEAVSVPCPDLTFDPKSSRYTLLYVHAEGGLGRIHIAQDNIIQRQVVLKEIKPQVSCCSAQNRFLREAQVTGQLEHPNIVPVYELSKTEEGNAYYVMRYLRGQTLKEAIASHHRRRKEGEVSSVEVLRLLESFLGICEAVAYAHSRKVLHRDLKPENVMLGRFGEVIVLDWGLAKVLEQDSDSVTAVQVAPMTDEDASNEETMTGEVLGTPAYMAPEQAAGQQDIIDYSTDVYGLGGILFEILTGTAPHQGQSTAEVLTRVANEPTPLANSRESSIPKPLNAICLKAMAFTQEDRYATASELAEDVRRYLANEPVTAYREPLFQRVIRWCRRHQALSFSLAGILVVGVLLMSISAVMLGNMATKEKEARLIAEENQKQSLRMAATFASRTVANEIDLRWRILETEARTAVLQQCLEKLAPSATPTEEPEAEKLLQWIESAFNQHKESTEATSWFLCDAKGTQLARWPTAKTIGKNYAFRDYFHGRGHDLDPNEGASQQPVKEAHRSIVFRSQASNTRMVAFTVPIWNDSLDQPSPKVLGVLGMTVELGRFASLQVGLGGEQVAVLVDTRPDGIKPAGRRGLVLHHPQLADLRNQDLTVEQKKQLEVRLSNEQIEKLCQLRQKCLEEESKGNTNQVVNWEENYRDPVKGNYQGEWLAAFAPVMIQGRPSAIKDTGWVVIVQERH